jgi:peptide/nickel transport system substrate-binding protein
MARVTPSATPEDRSFTTPSGGATVSNRRGQRKLSFLSVLLIVFALIAASCGGGGDSGKKDAGGTTTSGPAGTEGGPGSGFNQPDQSGTPTEGGSIVFGVESNIASLDPAGSLAQPSDIVTALAIYDQLIAYDPSGKLIPNLATEWSSSDDLKDWTIKLRSGINFTDGTPFNAAAVKAQFDRFRDPATNCTCAPTVAQITSVDAPNPTTVVFHLNAPNAFWANTLAGTLGFMESPTAVQKYGADYARHPVGTGPFTLQSYDSLILKKNPNYWKKDDKGNKLPYLDQIKIEPIPDTKVRLQSLRAGDIDMFQTADTDNIVQVLKSHENFKVQKVTGTSSTIVLFNLKKPPFDDIRMRQAFAYALNRTQINNVQYGGARQESYSAYNPGSPFYTKAGEQPHYNLAKAKQLVAELKKDGKSTSFTEICIPTDESRRVLTIVQQQMKAAGIKVDNQFKDQGAYVNQIFSKSGNYQAGCFRSPQTATPDGLHDALITGGSGNVMFYSNKTVDKELGEIRATTDVAQQTKLVKQVQVQAAKDLPVLQLLFDLFGNIYNEKVSGLPAPEPWSLGAIKVAGLYIKK